MYNFTQETPLKNSITEMSAVFTAIKDAYQVNHEERLCDGFRFGRNPICEHHITANDRNGAVLNLRGEFFKISKIADIKREECEISDYDKEYKARCSELGAKFKTALAKHWGVQEDCFEIEVSSSYSLKTSLSECRVTFKLDDLNSNQDKQKAIKHALATITELQPKPSNQRYNF